MPGAADIDMGLDDDALGVEFTLGGYESQLVKQMSASKIDGVQLRFAGSFQRDDTGEVQAVESYAVAVTKNLIAAVTKPATTAKPKPP